MTSIPTVTFGAHDATFYPRSLGWSDPDVFASVNAPPITGRYLIFVAVLSFLRLSAHVAPFDLLDAVPESVRADIRSGRALLVLDLSNEGPNFHAHVFDGFHDGMAANDLPLSSTMIVMQNRRMALDYRRAFGDTGLRFGVHDFFIKMPLAQFDNDLRDHFPTAAEVAAYEPRLDPGARDFLCFNATPRWHRILLYRFLTSLGQDARGLLSFHGANSHNPKIASISEADFPVEVVRDFGELVRDVEHWMPVEPIRFDRDLRMGNDLADSLETWAYNQSLYSIVSESDFFEHRALERATEKVVKAAALGHPFIVVGNPGTVRLMAELGFDTFEGVIESDYDRTGDNSDRLRLVFREIERQQQALATDRAGWIQATREGSVYNVAHARHGARYRYSRLVEQPLIARLRRFVALGSVDYRC